jgi:hypothetical protein
MRGGLLDKKSARRLMRRPGLVLLHAYGPDVLLLHGQEREALPQRVAEFIDGKAPWFTVFELGEFRDYEGRVMLVVQES